MNLLDALTISIRSLRSNNVRSLLTTLGIIIGVAAVIAMTAVTQGAKKMIQAQLTSLGGNYLLVSPGQRLATGRVKQTDINQLVSEDAEAIRNLSNVKYASELIDTTAQVVFENRSWFTTLAGVGTDYSYINDWFPEKGNFFNNNDVKNSALVCVIGKSIVPKLFGYQNPVGKVVKIGNYRFKVIGIMASIGNTPSGKDQDDVIFLPYTTLQKKIMGISHVEKISVSVDSPQNILIAESEITKLMRERHNLTRNAEDDFHVSTQLVHIERIFKISRIMTILLGSIASISLVVGGIGIMNIMLVSVRERTREIGIRLAVGAKEKEILIQFLVEAVLLSLIGGLIGVIVGISGSMIVSSIIKWPAVISPLSIIVAFFFAAVVGIFFGIYPARKASQLDPIEALRYE